MKDKKQENPEQDWQAKALEYEAGWKRALADLDNYRKDTEKRQGEMVQFLKAATVSKFLDIYEDLERALQFVTEQKAKTGLMDVQKKFRELLSAEGFEQIDLAPGTDFDPNLAEAVDWQLIPIRRRHFGRSYLLYRPMAACAPPCGIDGIPLLDSAHFS